LAHPIRAEEHLNSPPAAESTREDFTRSKSMNTLEKNCFRPGFEVLEDRCLPGSILYRHFTFVPAPPSPQRLALAFHTSPIPGGVAGLGFNTTVIPGTGFGTIGFDTGNAGVAGSGFGEFTTQPSTPAPSTSMAGFDSYFIMFGVGRPNPF
jgi:hypothetical protein